jgi:tetratricopeptide (TPR) repeat protein
MGLKLALRGLLIAAIFISQGLLSCAEQSTAVRLVKGLIVTSEGQPVAAASVAILDSRGVEVADSTTNKDGEFVIQATMNPGTYELVVASSRQLSDQAVALGSDDVDVRLTVPAAPSNSPRQLTVSTRQLGIPDKARSRLISAQDQIVRMNFAGAKDDLNAAIRLAPLCSEAWALRAFVDIAGKEMAAAIVDASQAAALDPNNASAYLALGTANNSLKIFGAAEQALHRAIALDSSSWQAQLELAKTWYGQGRFVLALWQLNLVNHDFADVHLVRANLLSRLGRQREAVPEFANFVNAAPTDSRVPQIRKIILASGSPMPSGSRSGQAQP